jgi:predicted GTPase
LSRRCDVVLYMLDNERGFHLDLKMFAKLKKRVPGFHKKLVLALNKADLFHPYDWDEAGNAPSERMHESISRRVETVTSRLELKNESRVVPLSALHGWNVGALLAAMVDAAGESKGASLLRAVKRRGDASPEDVDTAKRFGVDVAAPVEPKAQ